MRFSVESWSPDYGSPMEAASQPEADSGATVNMEVELPAGEWKPIGSALSPAPQLALIDGVRRIDARVWVLGDTGQSVPGICASYAAGVVRCGARAEVVAMEVERGLFVAAPASPIETSYAVYLPQPVRELGPADKTGPAGTPGSGPAPEDLGNALQRALRELEIRVAEAAGEADLVVIDGSLRGRQHLRSAIGYIKSHWVSYLPEETNGVVGALAPGERTPLFRIEADWSRYSWYLRLPGGEGHPWAGVVRCEVTDLLPVAEARRFADLTCATLPRYASEAHKDTRAPQNLYPIAGLERELRRRLGDRELLLRGLRVAAGSRAR